VHTPHPLRNFRHFWQALALKEGMPFADIPIDPAHPGYNKR
jgi:hypothetical protein